MRRDKAARYTLRGQLLSYLAESLGIKSAMNISTHKHLQAIPAIYFMLLGTFFIVMELSHSGLSLYWFCMYAVLFLPILIPVKLVWTIFGITLSLIFGLLFLNQFVWFLQYVNGTYFKYPFDSFVVGFPFIIYTLLCALSFFYIGLTSEDNVLIRLKRG